MRPGVSGISACTAVALLAVLLGALYSVPEFEDFRTGSFYYGVPEHGGFEPVGQGGSHTLLKWSVPWHLTPFHQETLDIYLIRTQGGWCLSDAGGYDTWLHRHASALLAAVQRAIGEEPLRYVLLTHGHVDHVGGLALLLARYPDLKVAIHEAEQDFVAGPRDYFDPAGKSWQKRVLELARLLPASEFKVAPERLVLLRGQAGGLGALGAPELGWTHTPGHSPGHVVFLHRPSGRLLAGDIADVLRQNDGRPALNIMAVSSSDVQSARRSLCRVVRELVWERALPYHDAFKRADGYGRAELLPLAEAHAGCSRQGSGGSLPQLRSGWQRLKGWLAAQLPGR